LQQVVDTSALEDEDLRNFLAASRENFAVISDYVGLEASSGLDLALLRRMSILKDFPQQVIVLTGTKRLFSVHPRTAGLRGRLIDRKQTAEFQPFIRLLLRAGESIHIRKQLDAMHEKSNAIKANLQTYADGYADSLRDLETIYSPTELHTLRCSGTFPQSASDKARKIVANTCYEMLREHGVKLPRTETELFNSYAFRHSLCWHLLELERLFLGTRKVKAEVHANDIADLHIVTCATYFDGFLTLDKTSHGVYGRAYRALRQLLL
jgi:hypothetical protein